MKRYISKLKIQEDGSGLVKIPKEALQKYQLKEGDSIYINPQKNNFSLSKLLEGINEDNLHGEIDSSGPVGKELL